MFEYAPCSLSVDIEPPKSPGSTTVFHDARCILIAVSMVPSRRIGWRCLTSMCIACPIYKSLQCLAFLPPSWQDSLRFEAPPFRVWVLTKYIELDVDGNGGGNDVGAWRLWWHHVNPGYIPALRKGTPRLTWKPKFVLRPGISYAPRSPNVLKIEIRKRAPVRQAESLHFM